MIRALSLLRDYVAIPSVNPMDRDDLPDSITGERRYAEHVEQQLRRLGLDARVVGDGSRCSVIAEARASDPAADTLLVASHLDTVPVDGMEIDPFDPKIEDERLYGRGSCDTKAGLAALMAALERVVERGRLRRNLIVVGEADEELGSRGVRDVLAALSGRRPDWVLATEPTSLRVVNRHKGIVFARLVARGRACHASDPSAGRSAIVSLARTVLALEVLAGELGARVEAGLGSPTLSVGQAGGGQAPNIVPDEAWLLLDRRLLPGESADSVRSELEAVIERADLEGVEVDWCRSGKGPLGTPEGHASISHCRAALAASGRTTVLAGVGFGTDAGVFAEAGIPGVVMGPGSIERAHTASEYVEIDEVEAMTEFFVALLEGTGEGAR